MQTEFQKLVKYLKKQHCLTQREIAFIIGIDPVTVSQCLRRRHGHTGAKYIPALKDAIAVFEGTNEVNQPFCPKCSNAHIHHPEKGPCWS